MTKFKVSFNDSQILVKCKLDKSATVNQKELDIFSSKFIRGLMRPKVTGNRKIEYTAPGNITLKSYLRSGISKKDFYIVFAQLIECIKKIEHYGFNINNLYMDTQYTFYNQVTREVQFLYQPFKNPSTQNNIFSFIYEIASETVLNLNESIEFLNDLIAFTNKLQAFSTATMETYLMRVYPQVYKTVNKMIPEDSINLDTTARTYFEKKYNTNVFDETGDEEMLETVAFTDDEMPETVAFIDDEMPETVAFTDDEMPITIALNNDFEIPYANNIPIATITRVSNGEVIQISKSDFFIGKQHDKVDYCISDNNTISRIHAIIKYESNCFYLIDLDSSNHSYVDGVLANSKERYTLFKGTRFYLSDEEFIFNID